MPEEQALKIYFVVGEDSGDALGADLLEKLRKRHPTVKACGLVGPRMKALGILSLFDISDISVMGISAVAAKLPKLLSRIRQTSSDVIREAPDVLLLIDSPEFSYRVAKRVKEANPKIKIIKYVAPSVWAWRPGRAQKIKPYIDHILAILPFEPNVLSELGGPDATYVGHPLATRIPDIPTAEKKSVGETPVLLALPGSRSGEINRLMPIIGETLNILRQRGKNFKVILPAVEHQADKIRLMAAEWEVTPKIVLGEDAKLDAFRQADLALAASGTVTLELALYKVPMIAIYKLDWMAMQIRHLLTGWTASLPNLIADYPVVPEHYNERAHPHYLARMVERLCHDDHERQLQLEGFERIIERLRQKTPSSDLAADTIVRLVQTGR